jgi:small subunit ribosomal protein S4
MRYLDSKCKLCRREGVKLFLKADRCSSPKCPIDKKGAVPPGQHGLKQRRRTSEYGKQLREKQKAKRFYGISEKQFRNYFDRAFKKRGATGEALLQLLEMRLDNVVYVLGFAPSRFQSRQIIGHGHILVDGKKVDIASFQLRPDQVVTLGPGAMKKEAVKKLLAQKKEIPEWLQKKASFAKILRRPARDEVASDIDDKSIVEFYSK